MEAVMSGLNCIDLRSDFRFLDQYIELRNRYAGLLMTKKVEMPGTLEWFKRDDIEVLGLVEGETLHGVVVLYIHRKGEVAVLTRIPGKGVGSPLLNIVKEKATLRGLKSIWAWVRSDNLPAQRLFEKNGYVRRDVQSRIFDGETVEGTEYTLKLGPKEMNLKRTSNDKVEFFKHNINDTDVASLVEVLNSVFLTTGPKTAEFEKKFATYLGAGGTAGVSSCTAALHLALLKHGIGPRDEVITTPMTFVATATAILQAGAKPVFVDVNPKSALLEPSDVEKAITPNTKCILPVHLYGRMADMRGFRALADKHGLALIEDAAHCVEGIRDGVRPGQLGDAACFSFYATKNMTSGEGGALAFPKTEDADWYRSARHHGITKGAAERYTKKFQHWDMTMMGWKYNMDDIQSSLLLNQLTRLEENLNRRTEIASHYRELLADVEGLEFPEESGNNERSAHHLFTVWLPRSIDRDEVVEKMQGEGIGCAVNYRAVHTLTYFKETYGYRPEDFPTAFEIGNRTLTLPLYPKLTVKEVERVAATLRRIIGDVWIR